MAHTDRVVVLVDMDCFYCQVEEKLDPALEGKPIAVVQYNAWRGGGIIAVNYPARDRGVTRHMRGDDAKKMCPDIVLARVPNVRGKADLTKYREAGQRVAEVLQTFTPLLERASVDEAYLDITESVKNRMESSFPMTNDKLPNTFVVNCDTADFLHNLNNNSEFCKSNQWLAVGGMIVEEIRKEVYMKTGYKCSAGIAHNKILAKLVCGLHKPNKQTILPQESVAMLYEDLPIRKIKSLGGKFGNALAEELNISMMGELIYFSEKELIKKFDAKTGKWLYSIARGIDTDPVTTRLTSKSIGCCKRFPGSNCLRTSQNVEHWLNELATEISERLEKDLQENKRKARQIVVSFAQGLNDSERSSTRTQTLNSYKPSRIATDSMEVIKKYCKKIDDCYNITFLGLSVGNFQEIDNNRSISSFFKNISESKSSKSTINTEKNESFPKRSDMLNKKENDIETSSIANDLQNDHDNSVQHSSDKSEECDNENLSIYSATTEELDEDPRAYIYYDDVFPIESKNSSENRLEISESSNNNEVNISKPTSFFGQYFYNSTEVVNETKDTNMEHPILTSEDTVCSTYGENNDSFVDANMITDKQTCPDCNKQIFVSEIAAHMDYHFALKLVKSEAHLYKSQMPQKSSILPGSRNKNQKRRNTNTQAGLISKFLQPSKDSATEVTDGDKSGEFCQECNKRVKLDDKIKHDDYHLAKKLHAELNASINIHRNQQKSSSGSSKDKKITDISKFFSRKS